MFLKIAFLIFIHYSGYVKSKDDKFHMFYRDMNGALSNNSKRIFGGNYTTIQAFPFIASLLNTNFEPRCTATIIKTHWCLTAAHCLTNKLAYVKYNTAYSSYAEGYLADIQFAFIHPKFKVKFNKIDHEAVLVLEHDIGLVRTLVPMNPFYNYLPMSFLADNLNLMDPSEIKSKDRMTVYGFGQSEYDKDKPLLLSGLLKRYFCDFCSNRQCLCAVPYSNKETDICAADSGSPLMYKGVQIGVASLGPQICLNVSADKQQFGIFYIFYEYTNVLLNTMDKMDRINASVKLEHSKMCFVVIAIFISKIVFVVV